MLRHCGAGLTGRYGLTGWGDLKRGCTLVDTAGAIASKWQRIVLALCGVCAFTGRIGINALSAMLWAAGSRPGIWYQDA